MRGFCDAHVEALLVITFPLTLPAPSAKQVSIIWFDYFGVTRVDALRIRGKV